MCLPLALDTLLIPSVHQVQDAIHAPHISWETCGGPVYINPTTGGAGNDQSVASTLSVLPNVIEKSERVAIVHGLAVTIFPVFRASLARLLRSS